jgi:HSP20 family protein
LRHDFHRAHFKEIISLPDNIHRDRISAKVDNGILTIVLPKVLPEEQAKLAQTITIE